MNKKKLPLIGIALVILIGGIFAFTKMRGKNETTTEALEKKKLSLPEVKLEEAPYVLLEPVDSRNIAIQVKEVKKAASEMDYELEYQAGTLLQGAFGLLSLDSLPITEKILLGSCSAGGACTYHTDVKGGSFLGRFTGGEDDYQKKADWKYIENPKGETAFSSKDGKFQISSKDLKSEKILIIFNGFGYPKNLEKTADSSPYVLATTSKLTGSGELIIRADSEDATQILGYDGQKWHEFETTKDGKMLTAKVDLMELYLAVK